LTLPLEVPERAGGEEEAAPAVPIEMEHPVVERLRRQGVGPHEGGGDAAPGDVRLRGLDGPEDPGVLAVGADLDVQRVVAPTHDLGDLDRRDLHSCRS
jgi:hypothetical protein